jgi:hypothetical protein
MNIFILDLDPKTNASYHCDKHVIKMITEYTQILSTVCRLNGLDCGYKMTHEYHPVVKWCNESKTNWLYLRELTKHLNNEYRKRFNHGYNHKAYNMCLTLTPPDLPIGLTPFANVTTEQHKHKDVVTAYRDLYMNEKRYMVSWKTKKPEWFV